MGLHSFIGSCLQGAEALVVNGVNQVLCVSMADALSAKLEPALQEKQV